MKVVKYTIHGSYGYRIHQNFTVCHPLDVLKKNMSGELIWTWTPGPLALWDKTLVILLLRSYSMGPVYRKWVPFNDPCRNPKMKKYVAPSNSKLRQIESHTTSDGFFLHPLLAHMSPFPPILVSSLAHSLGTILKGDGHFWETPIKPRKEALLLSIILVV